VVIDFVGASHWEKNIDSLAVDGRMVLLATLGGDKVPEVDLNKLLRKRLRIQGSTLRSRTREYQQDLIQRFWKDVDGSLTAGEGKGPVKTYIHKVRCCLEEVSLCMTF